MADHAWCHDPARDEAVRAAEDGRTGPLPTLGEAIARPFAEAAERSSTVSKTGDGQSGMRTERVTLEFEIERGSPPSEWPWSYILSRSDALKMRPGESVRVVDAHAEKVAESVAWEGARDAYRGRIARLTAERDDAIREREELRGERDRANDKHQSYRKTALARVAELEADVKKLHQCPECNGEAQHDSGGTDASGEWINLPCDGCGSTGTMQGYIAPTDKLHARLHRKIEFSGRRHRWDRDGERCLKCNDKAWMGGPCNTTDDEYIEKLTAEREAAIRERESLREQLESVACRAATAETALEARNVTPGEGLRAAKAASGGGEQLREQVAAIVHEAMRFHRLAETERWQAGNSFAESRARQAAKEIAKLTQAASGGGEEKPVAWGVRRSDGTWWDHIAPTKEQRAATVTGRGDAYNVVSPLFEAPPQPRGWLTPYDIAVCVGLRDQCEGIFKASGQKDQLAKGRFETLSALLARSSPPEVVLDAFPTDETGESFSRRDVIAALAAAGVAVKEVGSG